ncbi:hypothetical protein LIA77_09804 [Sarocladium implicatum]|jgi:hypothetical protein|nr:hypothetical protein LIA77_09804 [Sarocladium implicatum]
MYRGQEELDNLVRVLNDEASQEAQTKLRLERSCREVQLFAMYHVGAQLKIVPPLVLGGFNLLYRLTFESSHWCFGGTWTRGLSERGRDGYLMRICRRRGSIF